jgi:transcriptional regulator with XRE-family HTH domain
MSSSRRKIFTIPEYQEFARRLDDAIKERGLQQKQAATLLGVTRQALHMYRTASEHQPRWRVIERACRALDLSFVVQGKRFDKGSFGTEGGSDRTQRPAVQLLLLPEAIAQLEDANLGFRIVRKEATRISLELDVEFSA